MKTIIHFLRRHLLPCIYPDTEFAATTSSPPSKKRLSASLSEGNDRRLKLQISCGDKDEGNESNAGYISDFGPAQSPALTRSSKTMVIGTIFGRRRGHVWFCIQQNRLCTRPFFLIAMSIPIQRLVKEMCSTGLVRLALECSASTRDSELVSCPLRSIPVWTLFCNGRKLGFAVKKKVTKQTKLMLKTMQSITVGAGVIPATHPSEEEIMYMRANYEHLVGSADSESFHLVNPDSCPGQDLSVFLLRSQ